jgi:hypothetical protein
VTNAPVDEQIGCWNVIKKQYKEGEYVAVKRTKSVIMSYNSICLMCCHWWHILLLLPLSYPENENRQAPGRKWKSKWI